MGTLARWFRSAFRRRPAPGAPPAPVVGHDRGCGCSCPPRVELHVVPVDATAFRSWLGDPQNAAALHRAIRDAESRQPAPRAKGEG